MLDLCACGGPLEPRQAFSQLDVGPPRIREKGDGNTERRNLSIRHVKLHTRSLKLLAERLQILDLEPDVIERAPFRAHYGRLGFGEAEVHARHIGGLKLAAFS